MRQTSLLTAAEDQSFNRQTVHRTDPTCCPCLIPKGKYVVTKRWALLRGAEACLQSSPCSSCCTCDFLLLGVFALAEEKMALQGVSPCEMEAFHFNDLSDAKQSDLAGNALGPQSFWSRAPVVACVLFPLVLQVRSPRVCVCVWLCFWGR